MAKYTNVTGVSLPLAVWLATDEYDGKRGTNPYLISATGLLKSPRQIVLGMRSDPEDESIDVSGLVKSNIGKAVHDAVERSWSNPDQLVKTLQSLGYSEQMSKRIVVNPPLPPTDGSIPVYIEQRASKQLGKWTITGKFDMVFDGSLSDIKTTTTFTYVKQTKDDDYSKQGSVYRWLNPNKIVNNVMSVDFIFTDFKTNMVGSDGYPPAQTVNKSYPLMSAQETESWIKSKLNLIETLELTPEDQLPECNDKELWRSESTWKYYKSGQVTSRSTKNFSLEDGGAAAAYKRKVKGQPTACLYCAVANKCTQKDAYISSGELVI
jgi:hypothetical protein